MRGQRTAEGGNEVLVVIPAYNEEQSIAKVVEGVRLHIPPADILVVDDGSSDDTSRRVLESGAELLRLPCNLGVGAALEVALRYADNMGYAYTLRLDADGQHDPRDALRLLNVVRDGEADVSIGSRFLAVGSRAKQGGLHRDAGRRRASERESALAAGAACPVRRHRVFRSDTPQTTPVRALGIKVFATLVSLLISQPISDPTCGLRCFNRTAMRYLARHHPQDYPEVESMVVLHRAGFRLKELPVEIYPRIGGVSSISTWKAVLYVFRVMLAASIAAVRSVPDPDSRSQGDSGSLSAMIKWGSDKIPEEEPDVA